MVTPDDVRMAYRLFLEREPESDAVVSAFTQLESLAELRLAFMNSEEYLRRARPVSLKLRLGNFDKTEVEIDCTKSELNQMISHVERNWQYLGESEPYWSVFADENFRMSHIQGTEHGFFETGRELVRMLIAASERCGVTLDKVRSCFELGCGVGRVTVWLAEIVPELLAVDISQTHLALAQRAVTKFGRSNVRLRQLPALEGLQGITGFDLFVSVIVLQHNPPPVILHMLRTVFSNLAPGGIAYFQVPTYQSGYRFIVNEYLRGLPRKSGIEMHVLPQNLLFDACVKFGCKLLEIREDNWVGLPDVISNTVMLQKN